MVRNTSIESRLHEVGDQNLLWSCVDRRSGLGLHYGVAGGADGLAQDVDAALALQSHNHMPIQHDAAHIRAKILCKQLGGVGITIVNHNTCAAIDNRRVIASKIIADPEAVYMAAAAINPDVTEDQVGMLSEHYAQLDHFGKIASPDLAIQSMTQSDRHPAIHTVSLEPSVYDVAESRFIVNDLQGVAFERTGEDYEFSLAAVRSLASVIHKNGLYPVSMLPQAASIRTAAVKLVLPSDPTKIGHLAGPDIVRLAA